MLFGGCTDKMPASLAGPGWPRPSPRAVIVGERLWAGASAASQDVLERVGWDAPPPPPPSPPPTPGGQFAPTRGVRAVSRSTSA